MSIFEKQNLRCALMLYFFIILASCGGVSSDPKEENRYSKDLFGANYNWKGLAGKSMLYGDLIRDRSFRCKQDLTCVQVWGEIPGGGSITWNTTDEGDENPVGGKHYTGYVRFLRTSAGFTGIRQTLITGVKTGNNYKFCFSSCMEGSTSADIGVYLYLSATDSTIIASGTATVNSNNWTKRELTLSPNTNAENPVLGIYLRNAATVRIDEIRLFQEGREPAVSSTLKNVIGDLGVKALRWPGGTIGDWFYWKDSIGSRISRGELEAYGYFETPALGLHEFLNLCEELNIKPLIQVNIFDTPASAANLVEYVLGSSSTAQGAIRASNGRTNPWDISYFEIGNEPAESYAGAGLKADGGKNYASLANAIISAMKAKANSFGKIIHVGVINEPCFQKATWLVPALPDDAIELIYYWNQYVFENIANVSAVNDFTNGHFYSSRYYFNDPESDFKFAMSGGELLKQTIKDNVAVHSDLPFWLTEYGLVIEDGAVLVPYLKDFQAGLAAADILIHAIQCNVAAASIHTLIDLEGFGIVRDAQSGVLRPTGLAFKMISVIADEKKLSVSVDNTGSITITGGHGNVPSTFTYPLVSALASVNKTTGKPRVLLLNRSYDTDITVTISLEGYKPGSATCYYLRNSSITANNESGSLVSITTGSAIFTDPFTVTVQRHSLMRIDF